MPRLSRRALLAAGTALALAGTARAARPYVTPRPITVANQPLPFPSRPFSETLWGQRVSDPYRWMEAEDAQWRACTASQAAYAEAVLSHIPGRDSLAAAIAENSNALTLVAGLQTGGRLIFTERRPPEAQTTRLYVRDGQNGADRLLLDPMRFSTQSSHAALDWWQASPAGTHLVFGISQGGSEHSVLRLLEVETGQIAPLALTRTDDANPSWLPDGSGFFYTRNQDVPIDDPRYEENSSAWLHLLNGGEDRRLLGPGLASGIALNPIDSPTLIATPGSDLIIAQINEGVRNEIALYLTRLPALLAGRPDWQPICTQADQVTDFAVRGDEIFLLTHKHASHYRVVKLTAAAPHFADAQEVVPTGRPVIRAIMAAKNGLYLIDRDAGLAGLRHLGDDGKLTALALPFPGALDPDLAFSIPTQEGLWFPLEGWVRPCVFCHAGADGQITETGLAPQPDIDVSAYTTETMLAPARDGVRVPLSLLYRKGLTRDGSATLLMEAYGAYGIALEPAFMGRWLPFLDQGAVFAVAHVRGGGELGEDWHLAGMKAEKYHSWQDAEDCALHLIDQGYCGHRTLGVVGGSAGGITVGRLLTERPELAAVAISMVGVSDPLRAEFSPNGPPNIPEFGSVKTERGFHDLFAMDAYQHVHDGVDYPAVLLTTGLHDPRVSPWEATKMAARLQAASASKNPILLRVEDDGGHGFGATRAQRDAETADIMAFTLWRTGHPGFQPG